MNIKKAIAQQKLLSRKVLASLKINRAKNSTEELQIFSNERKFIKQNFGNIKTIEDLMSLVHTIKHKGISKSGKYTRCKLCRSIYTNLLNDSETLKPVDILPRFGNLIAILEQEVDVELKEIEKKRLPSQNDLRRYALKCAVLEFYKDLTIADDKPIIENRFDERLITELAPDFDAIADLWMKKLDEMKLRDDKYTLNFTEYDDAESDLADGMRGSAFEKQLDRYRKDFMKKLPR